MCIQRQFTGLVLFYGGRAPALLFIGRAVPRRRQSCSLVAQARGVLDGLKELLISGSTALARESAAQEVTKRSGVRDMAATHEYTPGSPLVIIHSLFDSEDIQQIDRLSEWVKKMHPTQHVCRQFDQAPVEYVNGELVVPATTQNYGGGNDVTHIHGFAQISIPHLLEHIICSASEATMTARWFPHPRQLGIRCVESLLYHAGGKLKLHTDSESIYTIVVMLSEPCAGAFTGGDFVIRESTDRSSDALLRAAPKKGDAIMCVHQLLGPSLAANPVHAAPQLTWGFAHSFDSNILHGVDTILLGERRVLVLEVCSWPRECGLQRAAHSCRTDPSHGSPLGLASDTASEHCVAIDCVHCEPS